MEIKPIAIEDTYNPFGFLNKENTSLFHEWTRKNLETTFKKAAAMDLIWQDKNSGVCIQYLPWDTDFFGFKVGKIIAYGKISHSQIEALVSKAKQENYKYLFTQIDCQSKHQRIALQENNFKLVETRLTYFIGLNSFSPAERYDARLAEIKDIPFLSNAAVTSVNEHDRFHADPIFPKNKVDALMAEWVKASLTSKFADGATTVNSETPGAFCTFKTHKEHWNDWGLKISQPVFSAVSRDFKGWYIKIISELTQHLKNQGANYSYLITQNTNPAVIKSWERLGYRFASSDYIFSLSL